MFDTQTPLSDLDWALKKEPSTGSLILYTVYLLVFKFKCTETFHDRITYKQTTAKFTLTRLCFLFFSTFFYDDEVQPYQSAFLFFSSFSYDDEVQPYQCALLFFTSFPFSSFSSFFFFHLLLFLLLILLNSHSRLADCSLLFSPPPPEKE